MFLYERTVYEVWKNGVIFKTQRTICIAMYGFKTEELVYYWSNGSTLSVYQSPWRN